MHKNHGFCCRSRLNEISQITVCVNFYCLNWFLFSISITWKVGTSHIFNDCNLLSGETSLLLKRFRHSITPTRPKMPTWRRKVMVEFAKPVFSEKHPTTEFLWQECPRIEEDLKSQKVQCSIWQKIPFFSSSWQHFFYLVLIDKKNPRKIEIRTSQILPRLKNGSM